MNTDNEAEPDVPTEDPKAGLPLMVVKNDPSAVTAPATPQQMRVMEVNEALAPAYAKASMLELSDHEIAALTAPFPDHIVEVRPHDGLIYIPHIHISNRLNEVIKPGKWSLICRRHWLEGGVMYGEYILLIRGAYVGESVGGHPYVANNPKTNYSDSLESTAGEALRRICGKRLSCGSQVWDPSYAQAWCDKWRGFDHTTKKYFKKISPAKLSTTIPTQTVPAKPKTTPPPPPVAKKPDPADHSDEYKKEKARKFAKLLENVKEMATQFCIELGWILPTEGLESVSYTHLPKTEGQFKNFKDCLEAWAKDGTLVNPYAEVVTNKPAEKEPEDLDDESDATKEPWYNIIVPVPHKGEKRDEYLKHPDTIGSLYELRHEDEDARKRLFGFVNHFEPKGWTGKDGKTHPPSQSDIKFRESLDQFMEFFQKSHPDEKL